MTYKSGSTGTGELEAVARLIERSSLGSPEAREARESITVDEAAELLERSVADRPRGSWTDAPWSSSIASTIRDVVPNPDGSVSADMRIPTDGTLMAVAKATDGVRRLDRLPIVLPGLAARTQWRILWFPPGKYRWRTTFVPRDVPLEALAARAVRVFDILVLWSVRDTELTCRAGATDFECDITPLLGKVAERASRSADRRRDEYVWRVAFAALIREELKSIGLDVEILIQPRISSEIAFPDEAKTLLRVLTDVVPHGDWNDLASERLVATRAHAILGDVASGAFMRGHFVQLVEAFRVLGLGGDGALDLALDAFERLHVVWDVVHDTDRLPILATAAIQAVQERELSRVAVSLRRIGSRRAIGDSRTGLKTTFQEASDWEDAPTGRGTPDNVRAVQESRYDRSDVPLADGLR